MLNVITFGELNVGDLFYCFFDSNHLNQNRRYKVKSKKYTEALNLDTLAFSLIGDNQPVVKVNWCDIEDEIRDTMFECMYRYAKPTM